MDKSHTFWVHPRGPLPEHSIALPAADQIGVRAIVPRVLCFTTDHDFDQARFVSALRLAVAALLSEVPALAGRITWADQAHSRVQVSVPRDASVEVKVVRLPHHHGPSLDALHWPPHALSYFEQCLPHRPVGALDNACFALQANLITDGLILVLRFNHVITDGQAQANVETILAHHISRHLDGKPYAHSGKVPAEALNVSQAWGSHPARSMLDWKDWRASDGGDNGPPPVEGSERPPLALTIWRISTTKLEKLRATAERSGSSQQRLSTAVIIAAFLWRAMARARGHTPDTMTKMLMPIQARDRVKMHPAYFGNALLYGRAEATAAEIDTGSLGELARRIDRSLAWWTPERIREFWGSAEQCENLASVRTNMNRDFGTDLEVSSLYNMPFYNCHWGRGLEIRAFRFPGLIVLDGYMNVLPRSPSGGCEFMIRHTTDALKNLTKDPLFMDYVEFWSSSDKAIDLKMRETKAKL